MSVAPLRLRAQRDGGVLCTSDGGSFFRTSPAFAARLASNALAEDDRRHLEGRGDWIEPGQGLAWEMLAYAQARRFSLARGLDYLILVPTLRCNLSCDYCQVSRVAETRGGFDWDEETLEHVLAFIDALETSQLKIEFQGGEPTLRLDLIQAVIDRCGRFDHAEFVICSNLQQVDDAVLAIFDREDVAISTSLDGDETVHQRHRTGSADKTAAFLANLEKLTRHYDPGKISALPTVDPRNPPEADALIDSYTRFGLNSIFLRPINFQGFARKRYKQAVAGAETWDAYYEDFVRTLIARNWQDRSRVLEETYLSICLRRIFQPGAERHVDLRNPNPMGVDYLVIDHDGTIYPTDEARMLARSGVIDLSIGSVAEGIDTEKRILLNRSASNSYDPDCQACAFQPYCGRDVVDDLSRYGTIAIPRLETEFCRRHRHIFDFAFELIYSSDQATRYSLCRWLGVPGDVALGETYLLDVVPTQSELLDITS